jgi:hypothetical protein
MIDNPIKAKVDQVLLASPRTNSCVEKMRVNAGIGAAAAREISVR